jgi:hypothetical protein
MVRRAIYRESQKGWMEMEIIVAATLARSSTGCDFTKDSPDL